ncbi:SIR2 family protein [Sorangium sp. So ce375]|uniref:SIR2 family protein n=1 Tax=Sorangium sp. So ce375 TaxID=3133306 RepID=UPI003F5AF901
MRPDELPDRVHIEALREALWRPESRAAVLVGAGMSRNAGKLSPAVQDFPLWWDIAAELRKTIDPRASEQDALRLGQMYENTYGRARLDDMLLELVPDGKYEPGALHQRLLQLPWADVFTTNYDTLLERARRSVPERKYEVVDVPADLTRAERPRIVKLHGSFPARRPFIFTEEDYRRYPADFAPFVNLVRQSAMENVLCLVGFSGSDPNFLQWAGWIRDQLGSTAPKIYLCGVLDLTTPKRSYYQHMQVIPVDLGPLFPSREWVLSDERQRAALAWLLETLRAGEPLDRSRWPELSPPASTLTLADPSPPILAPPHPQELPPEPKRSRAELTQATLTALLSRWKSERVSYPGWAVCPEPARRALWDATADWLQRFELDAGAHLLEELPLITRAEALHEIAWRAEAALLPLPDRLPLLIERTLEDINPRPRLIELRDASLSPDNATESHRWDALAEVWVNLAFSLVRHAWQFQDAALHDRWMDRLRRIAEVRSSWRARWWYDKCWHHLVRLETSEALKAARGWPEELSLPIWEAKRAAVLGELGQIDQAWEIATRAMERVRLGRDRARIDYQSLSEEGWILLLLQGLAVGADEMARQEHEKRERRLRELARDHCNPWDDLREREHALSEVPPGVRHAETRGFDPGAVHRRTNWSPWRASEWALINTLHDGPTRRLPRTAFLAALRRLWKASPRLVLGLIILDGSSDTLVEGQALSGLLGRVAIARLPTSDVNALYAWLTATLSSALARYQEVDPMLDHQRGAQRLIEGAAEVLSRLAFRLSEAQLAALFELTRTLYTSAVCQSETALHASMRRLLRRILYAATPQQIASWMPALLEFPLPDEPGVQVNQSWSWAEPFWLISWKDIPPLLPTDGALCTPAVSRLLTWARSGSPELRRRSSCRLVALALANALTQGQIDSLVGAIWSKTDSHSYPADISFFPWILLKLPERQPGEARRAIARHFRDAPFDPVWLQALNETTAPIAKLHEGSLAIPRVVWVHEEARLLLNKIVEFWRAQKPSSAGPGAFHRWRARDMVHDMCFALSTSIMPFLDLGDTQTRAQAVALAEELCQHRAAAVCILPSLLLLGMIEPAMAAADIHRALLGVRDEDVRRGVSALVLWLDLSGEGGPAPPPPAYLVDALVACVETGRHPGLTHTLSGVTALVNRRQPLLEARHVEALSRALSRFVEVTALDRMREDGATAEELPFDADEQIAILERASALAAALERARCADGTTELTSVAVWRELASAHVLPEVRRPWRAPRDASPGVAGDLDPALAAPADPARSV